MSAKINVIDTPKSVQLSLHRFTRNSELFGSFQWGSTPTAPNFIQICQEICEIRLTSLSRVCYRDHLHKPHPCTMTVSKEFYAEITKNPRNATSQTDGRTDVVSS